MTREKAENYFFIGSIVLAAILVALIFLPELNAIVLGITFAVLFQPLHARLLKAMPQRTVLAALAVVLLTVVIVFAPLVYIGVQLFGEASSLYAKLASGGGLGPAQYLAAKIAAANPSAAGAIESYLQQFFGWVASNVGALFSGLAGMLFAAVLSFFALYYFLRDGERLREAVLERAPLPRADAEKLLARLHAMMAAIIRGTLLMCAFYGLAVGVGFQLVGLPNGAFWGVVGAFTAFIPVFGTYLVIIPGMAVLAVGHHYIAAGALFIWMSLVGLGFENWLRPRLIGRKANIHPLLVLFSVVGGLSVFGALGILLGPLALGVLLALLDVYPVLAKHAE